MQLSAMHLAILIVTIKDDERENVEAQDLLGFASDDVPYLMTMKLEMRSTVVFK